MLERPDAPRDRFWLWRQRQKRGLACAQVEYSSDVVGLLVRLRWIDEREACDRKAVGRAISELLRDAARR
jgi:hypothetical protein